MIDRHLYRKLEDIKNQLDLIENKSELQLIALKQLIKVWSDHFEQINRTNAAESRIDDQSGFDGD